jgi:hypothetical protein
MKVKKRYKNRAIAKAKVKDVKEIAERQEFEVFIIGNPEFVDSSFVKFFFAFTKEIVDDENLAGKAIRLLFWIIKKLEYGKIQFTMLEKDVTKELGISSKTFYRWRKTLIEKRIIIPIARNIYAINPSKIFRGKAHPLLDEWEKLQELFSQKEERERERRGET